MKRRVLSRLFFLGTNKKRPARLIALFLLLANIFGTPGLVYATDITDPSF
jgi:hypothetical protein